MPTARRRRVRNSRRISPRMASAVVYHDTRGRYGSYRRYGILRLRYAEDPARPRLSRPGERLRQIRDIAAYSGTSRRQTPRSMAATGCSGTFPRFRQHDSHPSCKTRAVPGYDANHNAVSVNAAREAEEVHGGRNSSLHIAR
jgi:hypothetical protein